MYPNARPTPDPQMVQDWSRSFNLPADVITSVLAHQDQSRARLRLALMQKQQTQLNAPPIVTEEDYKDSPFRLGNSLHTVSQPTSKVPRAVPKLPDRPCRTQLEELPLSDDPLSSQPDSTPCSTSSESASPSMVGSKSRISLNALPVRANSEGLDAPTMLQYGNSPFANLSRVSAPKAPLSQHHQKQASSSGLYEWATRQNRGGRGDSDETSHKKKRKQMDDFYDDLQDLPEPGVRKPAVIHHVDSDSDEFESQKLPRKKPTQLPLSYADAMDRDARQPLHAPPKTKKKAIGQHALRGIIPLNAQDDLQLVYSSDEEPVLTPLTRDISRRHPQLSSKTYAKHHLEATEVDTTITSDNDSTILYSQQSKPTQGGVHRQEARRTRSIIEEDE